MEGEEDVCDYYGVGETDVRATAPLAWHPAFDRVTVRTVLHPVPPAFLAYLRAPDLHLPPDTATSATSSNTEDWTPPSDLSPRLPSPPDFFRRLSEDTTDSEGEDVPMNDPPMDDPQFPELNDQLSALIGHLGGAVFPKLSWKSPKDARWIALNKSLKCFLPGDIYLLFKCSNIIDSVLSDPFKDCEKTNGPPIPHYFVLKQWMDSFTPDLEFRSFVCNKKLTLICQRDTSQGFPSISKNRDKIIKDIHEFFRRHIHDKFPLDYYVFDVVRQHNGSVTLLDFNVFGLCTDPLLTSYRELKLLMAETNENVERGEARGLVEPEKYGEPYFRYLTDTQTPKPYPNIQAPLPTDVVTYLTQALSPS